MQRWHIGCTDYRIITFHRERTYRLRASETKRMKVVELTEEILSDENPGLLSRWRLMLVEVSREITARVEDEFNLACDLQLLETEVKYQKFPS
jgi:hypothetical protein